MKTKKFIKHELPADKYEIVETFSLSEGEYITCENCGKVIRNIAIVQDSKGKKFHVGLDCAETLSGIDEYDIAYWSENFNIAKTIRAKVNKARKLGAEITVGNTYWNKNIQIRMQKPGVISRSEEVTEDFLKKYLPELAKVCKVNYDFAPISEDVFNIENGETFNGYTFYYKVKTKQMSWGEHKFAYAEAWKDGVKIGESTNGGCDKRACMTECARMFNKMSFDAGLRPLC